MMQLTLTSAWNMSKAGEVAAAKKLYRLADGMISPQSRPAHLNADLSVLRHNLGTAHGSTRGIEPTEDNVVTFCTIAERPPEIHEDGWRRAEIVDAALHANARRLIETFDPGVHRLNIREDRSHVLTLSTGRCGTVSLYHLLKDRPLSVHHTYWWQLPISYNLEMMCRLMSGDLGSLDLATDWVETRAAEWLGDHRMIGLNHLDTIWAPVFAGVHPRSKFLHLHRNPDDVLESFWTKDQWGVQQLRPISYSLEPEFHWAEPDLPERDQIEWFIRFTNTFARIMGRIVGPSRFCEISADKLFARDETEIERLLDFIEADIPLGQAVAHYGTKINEKRHKVIR